MMRITIRNRRVLRSLGFDAQGNTTELTVSLTLRDWGTVLWRRVRSYGMTPGQIVIAATAITLLNVLIIAWQLHR